MPHLLASWVLATILGGAAIAKLANPAAARAGLASFGAPGWALWPLAATELLVAAGVAAGLDVAALAAAGLFAAFAGSMLSALARGRGGAPCGCFGARSRVSGAAAMRNIALAAAAAAVPFLPDGDVSTETWLAAGLVLALLGVAGLAVAVLALAREVGMLRLAAGDRGALEIAEEGPPVGERSALAQRFAPTSETRFALAVFRSDGCPACAQAEPAIASLAREPFLAVEVFDEVLHQDVWQAAAVPGSPYAVALDPRTGIVLAKGTFNGLAQLESILTTADHRAPELLRVVH